jgi:D-alanyl-D-alanine carboxypeptidase/D-alanyl-D-alanine-endopeptidase (penicillin-binding protein 4)
MRRIRLSFMALVTIAAGPLLAADPSPSTYLARLAAARIPADAAAVVVRPVDDGQLRFSANDRKPMNPASTMKIVTTYSALHLLGPAFTFRTEVLVDGPVAAGVLRGPLYVRGGGDPHLVIEDLWLLAERIRGYGIREIRGDVVLDKGFFAPQSHDPAAFDGEEGRAYNVGPDPLLLNFKSLALTFTPDPVGKVAHVMVIPEVAGMKAQRTVPAVEGGCGDWRGRLGADIDDPIHWRAESASSTWARSSILTTLPRCSARCGSGRAAPGPARSARARSRTPRASSSRTNRRRSRRWCATSTSTRTT